MKDRVIGGRYRVESILGEGGMGAVYRAFDQRDDRIVAIKTLHKKAAAKGDTMARFRREGEVLTQLDHPNIVRHLELVEEDGHRYLILEFGGGTLRDLMGEAIPLEQCLSVVQQVGLGLQAAHRAGVTHRDIKPDNILVDQDLQVRLTDFGVAHLKDGRRLTGQDTLLGTLDYMSPEALLGDSSSPSSDYWSLGVLFFELLSGGLPFQADTPGATLAAILHGDIPDLSSVRPELSEELADVVYRLLDRNPKARLTCADQLIRALGAPAAQHIQVTEVAAAPTEPTAFVGRLREIEELSSRVEANVWVTVVGAPGVGKSRLALEVVERHKARFGDGLRYLNLEDVDTPDQARWTLAQTLGCDDLSGLRSTLENRNFLLLVDNMEHLIEWAGELAELTRGTATKILATSRFRLGLRQESLYRLEPLIGQRLEEALELLAVMTRRTFPDFEVTHGDRETLLQICRALGGLPLSLELAGAWLRLLPPTELLEELSANTELLQTDEVDVSERHRSLSAALDTTWNLLNETERELAGSLSVFRAGFLREAAVDVAGANLRGLLQLTDKSLLTRLSNGRFELHRGLREIIWERLSEDKRRELLHSHARHYGDLMAKLSREVRRESQSLRLTLAPLESELDNCRQAWNSACDLELWGMLVDSYPSLQEYYEYRSRHRHARPLWQKARLGLESASSNPERDLALGCMLGVEAQLESREPTGNQLSQRLFERALALLDFQEAEAERAYVLTYLGLAFHLKGQKEEALGPCAEALELHRKHENSGGVMFSQAVTALALSGLSGREEEARDLLLECLKSHRRPNTRARLLGDLAIVELNLEDWQSALEHSREARQLMSEHGDTFFLPYAYNTEATALQGLELWEQAWDLLITSLRLSWDDGAESAALDTLARMAEFMRLRGDEMGSRQLAGGVKSQDSVSETIVKRLAWSEASAQVPLEELVRPYLDAD